MERTRVNIAVGLFLVLGILALAYLSINLGQVAFFGGGGYPVTVDFPSVGGLKPGSTVEIAGVEVGRVESIALADYQARVTLRVNNDVKLQEDAIASIKPGNGDPGNGNGGNGGTGGNDGSNGNGIPGGPNVGPTPTDAPTCTARSATPASRMRKLLLALPNGS